MQIYMKILKGINIFFFICEEFSLIVAFWSIQNISDYSRHFLK